MPIWLWAVYRRSGTSMRQKMAMHSTSEFITIPTTPGFHRLHIQGQPGKCDVTTYGMVSCWALSTLLFQWEWIVGNWKYDSVGKVLSQAQDLSLILNTHRRSQTVWACLLSQCWGGRSRECPGLPNQPAQSQANNRSQWETLCQNKVDSHLEEQHLVLTSGLSTHVYMDGLQGCGRKECWPNPEKVSSL